MKNLLNTEILTRKEVFLVLLWEKLKEIRNNCKFRLDILKGRHLFGCSVRNSSLSKLLPKKCDEKIIIGRRKRNERKGEGKKRLGE